MGKPTFAQIEHFFHLVESGVVTADTFQSYLEKPTRFFDEAGYPVSINFGQTLDQMIAAGKYDWKNDDINVINFPFKRDLPVDCKLRLVCLARTATTKEIEEHLDALGLKPAGLEHLLAFGSKYPDKQREFPIVALGSGWVGPDGDRFVPCLVQDGDKRYLRLGWDDPDGTWDDDYRFLAVSK